MAEERHSRVLEVSRDGRAALFAVVGPTAGTVAYNLAGMLARIVGEKGRDVLFVDAEGHASWSMLPGPAPGTERPDAEGAPGDRLGYAAGEGLRALPYPGEDAPSASALIERAREEFDVLFVACGESRYAADWLSTADRVAVSSASAREMTEFVRGVERLRGRDGTLLLAPMGRVKLSEGLGIYHVFRLPSIKSAAFEEAQRTGKPATLLDRELQRAFGSLLEELLDAFEESRPQERGEGPRYRRPNAEGPPAGPSGPRDAANGPSKDAAEAGLRGARGSGHPERADGPAVGDGAGRRRTRLGSLKAGVLAIAGRLRGQEGGSPAPVGEARAEVSPEEIERRLKLALRDTTVGGMARVCVGSPKGGVGKSSIAYALAGSVAFYTNMRVCLVDADPNFGSTRLLVPRPIPRSVVELAEAADGLSGLSDLRQYVAQDERMRLDVVLGPEQAHELARLPDLGEAYGRIDSVLSKFYDLVVYDLGLGFRDPAIRRVLSLSDELLFVTDSEIIPNAMLADAIKYVENLGVDLSKTMLVMNHRLPPADESVATSHVRASHETLLRRVTEVPYDAGMSRLLNQRSFHVENLSPRTRLGVLTTVAACIEGLRDAGGLADKVVPEPSAGARPDRVNARGREVG